MICTYESLERELLRSGDRYEPSDVRSVILRCIHDVPRPGVIRPRYRAAEEGAAGAKEPLRVRSGAQIRQSFSVHLDAHAAAAVDNHLLLSDGDRFPRRSFLRDDGRIRARQALEAA